MEIGPYGWKSYDTLEFLSVACSIISQGLFVCLYSECASQVNKIPGHKESGGSGWITDRTVRLNDSCMHTLVTPIEGYTVMKRYWEGIKIVD